MANGVVSETGNDGKLDPADKGESHCVAQNLDRLHPLCQNERLFEVGKYPQSRDIGRNFKRCNTVPGSFCDHRSLKESGAKVSSPRDPHLFPPPIVF